MNLPIDEPAEDAPESEEPVEVPHSAISAEALQALVESFVLREGTDYGEREFTHEQKVAQVMVRMQRGEVRIVYDPTTSSVTLLSRG